MSICNQKRISGWLKRVLCFLVASLTLLAPLAMNGAANQEKQPWYAPRQAKELKNPVGSWPPGFEICGNSLPAELRDMPR